MRFSYNDAEFLRNINVVPFDQDLDAERQRNSEQAAARSFYLAQEREHGINVARGVLTGIGLSLIGWAIAIAVCAL